MASAILTADIGTFDLTGKDVNLFKGLVIFTFLGEDVEFLKGLPPLEADLGSYDLTGLDSNIFEGTVTFKLNGLDVTLIVGVAEGKGLIAEVGSFVLTGIDACFEIAGGVNNFPRPKQRRPHLGELIEEEEIEILILIQAFLHQQHNKHAFS